MSGVWKKVDQLSWDIDEGKEEIDRIKREGFIPVEPIKPEPVLNESSYLILCEPPLQTNWKGAQVSDKDGGSR